MQVKTDDYAAARALWGRWISNQDDEARDAAFGLALEARLLADAAREDPEDLVAILPDPDLEQFIATGKAIRVYRGPRTAAPLPGSPTGLSMSLADLADGNGLTNSGEGPPWFAFAALSALLSGPTGRPVKPLGPILLRADRSDVLARTQWLLSRDLLKAKRRCEALAVEPQQATDLALRALTFYDLDAPERWRQGRRDRFREDCRQHALDALGALKDCGNRGETGGTATDPALAHYWQGLRCWYAGTDPLDLNGEIAGMSDALGAYLDQGRNDSADRRSTAKHLLDLANLVWGGDQQAPVPELTHGEPPTVDAVSDYLAAMADDTRPMEFPSPLLAK